MDLRHSTVTKNGKTPTYWRLVRSVRVGPKVRQETVAQLGELDAEGRIAARHLADSLVGLERQPGLFDEDLPTEPVTVVPSRLRLERGRRFGDVWLAWKLWQALGLDPWLEKRLPRGREDVPWSLMAAVLVIARLCEPSSELHIAEDWPNFRSWAKISPISRCFFDVTPYSSGRVPGKRRCSANLVSCLCSD